MGTTYLMRILPTFFAPPPATPNCGAPAQVTTATQNVTISGTSTSGSGFFDPGADTRGGAPIGGPVMQGQETRAFTVAGNCGIPLTAKPAGTTVHLVIDVNGYFE